MISISDLRLTGQLSQTACKFDSRRQRSATVLGAFDRMTDRASRPPSVCPAVARRHGCVPGLVVVLWHPYEERPSRASASTPASDEHKPLHQTGGRGFFSFMADLCIDRRRPDARRALRERRDAADPLRPTWSSSGWTRWPIPDVGRRAAGAHGPGHRDLPARPGRAGISRAARRSGCACWSRRGTLGAEFVDVEWAAPRRRAVGARMASAWCSRRTTSTACPPTWRRGYRAMRQSRRGGRQDRRHGGARCATRCRCCDLARVVRSPAGAARDGRARAGHAPAARSLRVRVDLCGRRAGRRADLADRLRRRVPVRSRLGRAPALYGVVARPLGHSVSPAMHNARVRAAGTRRGLRAARSGRLPTTSWRSPARWTCAAPA